MFALNPNQTEKFYIDWRRVHGLLHRGKPYKFARELAFTFSCVAGVLVLVAAWAAQVRLAGAV